MKRCGMACCIIAVSALSQAQHISFSGSPYSQNFDTLSSSGTTNAWTNGSTPFLGWYMETITGSVEGNYRADTGTSNTGALYSYGSAGSAERALGALGSGTPQAVIFGFRMRNMTGLALGDFAIALRGEQWRNGGNTSTQVLRFSYKQDANNTPDANEFAGTDVQTTSGDKSGTNPGGYDPDLSWTRVNALDFTSPTVGAAAAALDGNAAANQAGLFASVTLSTPWQNGADMMFRFVHINDAGNDHGLAIDDLEFNAHPVPEPATLAVIAIGSLAFASRKRR